MRLTDEDLQALEARLKENNYSVGAQIVRDVIRRMHAAENSALDVPELCRAFDYCEEMKSYSQMSLDALRRHNVWLEISGRKSKKHDSDVHDPGATPQL